VRYFKYARKPTKSRLSLTHYAPNPATEIQFTFTLMVQTPAKVEDEVTH